MEAAKKTQSAKVLRQAALDNLHQRIAEANSQPPLQHDPDCVLEVQDLYKYFPIKTGLFSKLAGYVRAVDGISFKIKKGTTMGLVGESGCGKTTVGKTVLRLTGKTAGQVLFNGIPIHDISRDEMPPYARVRDHRRGGPGARPGAGKRDGRLSGSDHEGLRSAALPQGPVPP